MLQQRTTPIASFSNDKEDHNVVTTATCVIGNSGYRYSGGSSLLRKGWIDRFLNTVLPSPYHLDYVSLHRLASFVIVSRYLLPQISNAISSYAWQTCLCTAATFKDPALGSASKLPAPCHPLKERLCSASESRLPGNSRCSVLKDALGGAEYDRKDGYISIVSERLA